MQSSNSAPLPLAVRVSALACSLAFATLSITIATAAAASSPRQKRVEPQSACVSRVRGRNPYRDIRMDVFDNYVPALPIAKEPLLVTINLQLVALVGVNEPEETVVLNAWLMVYWKDEALSWKPEEFANISVAEFPSTSKLWLPDLAWYERIPMVEAYEYDEGLFNGARAVIHSTGDLYVSRGLLMRSHCKLQVKRFPFDTQICNFTFQSTVHNMQRIILRPHAKRVWRPESTEGWIVLAFPAFNTTKTYPEVGSFSRVIFSLKIKRKPLFYMFYLMLPNFMISVLGSFVFLLPPESSEKVTFCVSILLSLTIFMMIMLGLTPPSESVPLISMYFFMVLLTCMGNAAIVIVIQCLYDKHKQCDGDKRSSRKIQHAHAHLHAHAHAHAKISRDGACCDSDGSTLPLPLPLPSAFRMAASQPKSRRLLPSASISLQTANRVSRVCFVASLTFSLLVPAAFLLYGKYGGEV